jgi:general secretion pathway protein D
MKNRIIARKLLAITLAVTLLLPGTALAGGLKGKGKKNFNEGMKYSASQQWDLAAQEFALAVAAEPSNAEYRAHYVRALMQASMMFVKRGDTLAEQDDHASAYNAYRLAYNYDPSNELARIKMQRMLEIQKARAEGTPQVSFNPHTGNVVPTSGDIRVASRPRVGEVQKKIEIKDVSVKASIASLSRTLGLNVIFDETIVDNKRFSIDLADVTYARAVDLIFLQNKLSFEMVDRKTLFVYTDNPTNRQRFERLAVKTFYLNNAKLTEVRGAVQGFLTAAGGGRTVTAVDGLNALLVRATPGELQMVRQVIDTLDKNVSEVVIDISIYEISRTDALELGNQVALQSQPVTETRFDASGQPVQVTTGQSGSLRNLGGIGVQGIAQLAGVTFTPFLGGVGTLFGLPPTGLSLIQAKGRSRLLYNSQVHALHGEQNKTKLGRSVPVRTGTNYGYGSTVVPVPAGGQGTPTQQPTGSNYNAGLFDNIQYKDVGLVIDVTPKITNEGYVEIKMNLETSNVEDSGESGNLTPVFTQRTLSTTSRVRDGVTSVVGGVRQDTKGDARVSIPVIGMLPILGRFFSAPKQASNETDLVITVTPHIIRAAEIKEEDHLAQLSGAMQGGIGRSLEDVLQQVQEEDEQEKRMIAKMQPGANQGSTAGAPASTVAASTASGSRVTGSGAVTIPQNVPINTAQSSGGPAAPQGSVSQPQLQTVSAPAGQVPVQDAALTQPSAPVPTVPPSVQPTAEKQQGEEKANPTAADPDKAGQTKAAEQKPKTGETEEKLPFDPNEFLTKPDAPVAPARVNAPNVPEDVRKMIEERRKQAAKEFEEGRRMQSQPATVPDELKNQTSSPAAPRAAIKGSAAGTPIAVDVTMTPQQPTAQLNQPILLAVSSQGQGQLNSGILTFKFDNARFRVGSVRPGTLLGDKGSVVHQVTKDMLRITISDAGQKSLKEPGSLLIVELVPIGVGDSQITLNAADSSFELVGGSAVKFGAATVRLPVVK